MICLLGISPASEYYKPTFRNSLSVPSSIGAGSIFNQLLKIEPTQCSETSAFNTQTPGKYPEDNSSLIQHGESLKSRKNKFSLNKIGEIWSVVYLNNYGFFFSNIHKVCGQVFSLHG
jgi:hypothetical protein